jgi:type IX secretion system PorP/SprF family membrane protein
MKKQILLFTALLVTVVTTAQQLPQQSLWFFDPGAFNPALLSAESENTVGLSIRSQWTGMEGAPATQRFYFSGQVKSTDYVRVGILNDQAGAFARRGLNLGYTKALKPQEGLDINLGLRVGLLQSSFNEAQMVLLDTADPEYTGQSYVALNPSVTPGVSINYEGWCLAGAVPYAAESNFSISTSAESAANKWQRHMQVSLAKDWQVSEQVRFQPSAWIMSTAGAPTHMSFNVNAYIQDKFMVGAGYRNNTDLAIAIGASLGKLEVAYSYDIHSTGISAAASGSHEVGVRFSIASKYTDSDGDGVADTDDECPDVFGKLNGCPDSDMDGVADKDDQCPNLPGLPQFKGCPDTDGDGVPDKVDECPDVAGLPQFNGCPDSDGDGIPDHLDSCPKTPATEGSEDGCPELTEEQKQVIEEAFGNLEFETGKAKIKEASFAFLMKLAMLLKENPTWQVDLAGHTDNVGNEEANMELSNNRVQAVVGFLITLEVPQDRMIVSHFGESKPIDTNDTEEGRARNRRVEMKFLFE